MLHFQYNVNLKSYNTFGLDVEAQIFIEIFTSEDMVLLVQSDVFKNHFKLVIGGGSNIVFVSKKIEGLVVKNAIQGIEIINKTKENVIIKAGSGMYWHNFVLFCIENGWGGVENLSLIPGTVGAAPMQNIGAYGVELVDVFESLEALEICSGKIFNFDTNQCQFGYRESIFKNSQKNKFIIVSVTFRLWLKPVFNVSYGAIKDQLAASNHKELSVKAVSDAVIAIRKSKLPDPKVLGNCGSFFKNPEIEVSFFESLEKKYPKMPHYLLPNQHIKLAAGWLIEQCGWKGLIKNNVGAHKDQALVIVNYGQATGQAIVDLALEIQASVYLTFGIKIEFEVNIF